VERARLGQGRPTQSTLGVKTNETVKKNISLIFTFTFI
jgi:hypothetical protein